MLQRREGKSIATVTDNDVTNANYTAERLSACRDETTAISRCSPADN